MTPKRILNYLAPPLFLSLSAACAAPQSTAPEATSTPAAVATPSNQVKTPWGATLTTPKGFKVSQKGPLLELIEPDGKVKVFLLETTSADLASAIQNTWKAALPELELAAPSQVIDPPAAEGWTAIKVQNYGPDANGVFGQAVARQAGDKTWVTVLRGPLPAIDKRSAQIRSFLGSLKRPGHQETDLSTQEITSIQKSLPQLQSFIKATLAQTEAPGFALAILEDGKVVHREAFGSKQAGQNQPIDADTLFMIGSVTKSMTTWMMASAVDEGKLSWQSKVKEVYPDFKLGDEKLSNELLVEQLVCACAGLPRKDMPLLFNFEGKGSKEVFSELSTMKASTGLKETFQYQNHMVAAGGYVAAHALNPKLTPEQSFAKEMQNRLFAPLGMTRTTLDFDQAIGDANHALPHSQTLDGKHLLVPIQRERFTKYMGPSGGVWSSINEMSKYVAAELAGGKDEAGKQIVSSENLLKRRQRQVAITNNAFYGLGWITAKKKGLTTISHGGGTMGFATKVAFIPEKGLGVVMLSNGTGGHTAEALIFARIRELWFGINENAEQRLQVFADIQKKERAKLVGQLREAKAEELTQWAGNYQNQDLGAMKLTVKGKALEATFGQWTTELKVRNRPDGKTSFIFATPPLAGVELLLEKGQLRLERGQENYLLTKQN